VGPSSREDRPFLVLDRCPRWPQVSLSHLGLPAEGRAVDAGLVPAVIAACRTDGSRL